MFSCGTCVGTRGHSDNSLAFSLRWPLMTSFILLPFALPTLRAVLLGARLFKQFPALACGIEDHCSMEEVQWAEPSWIGMIIKLFEPFRARDHKLFLPHRCLAKKIKTIAKLTWLPVMSIRNTIISAAGTACMIVSQVANRASQFAATHLQNTPKCCFRSHVIDAKSIHPQDSFFFGSWFIIVMEEHPSQMDHLSSLLNPRVYIHHWKRSNFKENAQSLSMYNDRSLM